MLHALDLGANYWSLWTEADNLRALPRARTRRRSTTLQRRMGYRVRPSWVWQRKRYGDLGARRGVRERRRRGRARRAARVCVETPDGKVRVGGALDAGHPYGGRLRQASFVLPPGSKGRSCGCGPRSR